jgi:hypothetical protein
MNEVDPQGFVNSTGFWDSLEGERKERLKSFFNGGLFISHSSLDYQDARNGGYMQSAFGKIWDVVYQRFAPNGYFLYNLRSGLAERYRELVNIGLTFCDKFLLIVSSRSVRNIWVCAEVQFALAHQRPIIEAYLDDADINELYDILPTGLLHNHRAGRYIVDFNHDIEQGQAALARLLDQLLTQLPYPREQ